MEKAAIQYDMNLFRVFTTVFETRSVTEAAEHLSVSQPSVSYSLAKLRRLLSDPLFHRGPNGLEPSPLADRVYPEMLQAVEIMDSTVQGIARFTPRETTRTIRLMMTDLGLMALFPYIIRAIVDEAPQARIEVVPLDTAVLGDKLKRSEVDGAIGIASYPEADLVSDHLMDMPYVGICADTHPRMSETPSREAMATEHKVVVSNALGHEHVQERLSAVGVLPTPAIVLPHFAVLAQSLAVTEHISVVPKALADIFVSHGAIRQFELPFSVRPGHVALLTSRREPPSPMIDWLRGIVTKSLEDYPYPKYVPSAPGD